MFVFDEFSQIYIRIEMILRSLSLLKAALAIFAYLLAMALSVNSAYASNLSSCSYNGIPLYGKVKVVNSFPDIKVKIVSSFEDLDVQKVNAFADKCGKWQFVDSFPDFKIQFVDSFPDITIKFVQSFPGQR